MNRHRKLVASALTTSGVAGLALAGQYAGGALFARLEHLPDSAVGIFTLRDYWRAYGHVKSVAKVLVACSIASGAIPEVQRGLLRRREAHEIQTKARLPLPPGPTTMKVELAGNPPPMRVSSSETPLDAALDG